MGVDKSQQEKIVDEFNDGTSELKFIIVTAKLLTGFDAPILQTMYLDKSIKDHTLLQAICRAVSRMAEHNRRRARGAEISAQNIIEIQTAYGSGAV
ncbi:hypothetical protein [Nitrosomonas sp. Nm51]|uniref:type I restriction enzyme subunit R domain-containing protein n=1 Tax=Nitrosomonas sp. Nm51 TaxID=133720 RepID=UPI000B88B190|nr:hypothetical protein [Nitrosomonas sp. Nm51]